MVKVVDPGIGDTIYDPGCGTGGFLAQSYEYIKGKLSDSASADQLQTLKEQTFWGREKENLIYPIALANLILHGIDKPNIWHGNTLTGMETYGGLFEGAPAQFDVILTNPPFGGKEGKEAQTNFDYQTSATQVLFLQHVIRNLRERGKCGIVLDEGLLFRTNEDAFTKTKRKLLDDCNVWCILSLPAGVFNAAGAGVKTNLIFFTKGGPTRKIWYYDMSEVKVRKKIPLTLKHFEEFFQLLPLRTDSENSWTIDIEERRKKATDEARPFKEEATARLRDAEECKLKIRELKKADTKDEARIAEAEEKLMKLQKAAREAAAKAKEIEDAAFDLKAVNPHKKSVVDTRTPAQLLDIIERKGREIEEALGVLKNSP